MILSLEKIPSPFKLLNREKIIPWNKFFERRQHDVTIFELTPSTSVRNNQSYVLCKVMASMYRKPSELRNWSSEGTLLTLNSPYRFNFRIIMQEKEVGFYFILPTERSNEFLRKIESVYDNNITIKKINSLPKLNPKKTFCTELHYRKHDIFSLDTDRTHNYPLPSLLTAVRSLEGEDIAIFDAMFEPYHRGKWLKEAKEAHNLLEAGYVPEKGIGGKLLSEIQQFFNKMRIEILEATRVTKQQKAEFHKWKKEQSSYREAQRIRQEMTNSTRRKQDEEVLNTLLRIACQSESTERRKEAAYTIANAFKDLTSDNELIRYDIPKKLTPKYVFSIEKRTKFSIKGSPIKTSVEEGGKFIQLPGDSLIKEFKEIKAQTIREVSLPDEIVQKNIKGVRIGYVTERGKTHLAKIPLQAYKDVKLKHVYDALCTTTFCQGKQGSGKSEGFGTVWAYDMVTNGFTVIIIDTADGEVLRNFINSLPADFPDDKIHVINLDNKAYPIPLNWADVYGRTFAEGDAELQALEISERITERFISFINSLSNTGEFTDRMQQYVTSCLRAISTKANWSFLDLELALTSPSYREELLKDEKVRAMPDVIRDLNTLQEKAISGKAESITGPIMNRVKILSGTQTMANLFFQEPMLDDKGNSVLDFRKLMDNKEGGRYGHVITIQASYDAWNDKQAILLGFLEDKINFNAFSRIDTPQKDRKPVLKWIDEPHKVIKNIEDRLSGTSVEFRKYRIKNLFTGHAIEQMGKAANALLHGGAQITSYKTEKLSEFERFSHQFKPYTDAKELYDNLPEKWKAVNSVRLPSGKPCPAFIADMVAPPKEIKDRSYIYELCAKKYGRPWKEVRDTIQAKRDLYLSKDNEWYRAKKEEATRQKAEESIKLKKAKKEVEKEG